MFDLKRFLVENKLTKASLLNEAVDEALDKLFMQLYPQCREICKKQGTTKEPELTAAAAWKALKMVRKKNPNYKPSSATYGRWNNYKFKVSFDSSVDASQENPFTAVSGRSDVIRKLRNKE